jgi:hypothetical protein
MLLGSLLLLSALSATASPPDATASPPDAPPAPSSTQLFVANRVGRATTGLQGGLRRALGSFAAVETTLGVAVTHHRRYLEPDLGWAGTAGAAMHVGYRGPRLSATFLVGPKLLAHTKYGLVPSFEPAFELGIQGRNRAAAFVRSGLNVPRDDSRPVTAYERRRQVEISNGLFEDWASPPSYYWAPIGKSRLARGVPSLFVEAGVLLGL